MSTELTIYIKATCKQQLLCSSTCKQIYGDMICVDYDLVYDFGACRQASNVVQLSVESSIWFIYTFFFRGTGEDRGGRGKQGAKVRCFLDSIDGDSRCHVGSEVPGLRQRISRQEGS